MVDEILRIVPLFQLLQARIIFCAVISGWPIGESKVWIVCVMACDSGLGNMIAHPTYRFSKNRRVRGRFPVCLRLAPVMESPMRKAAFPVLLHSPPQTIHFKNTATNR